MKVAMEFGIQFKEALFGFEVKGGKAWPVFGGIVVFARVNFLLVSSLPSLLFSSLLFSSLLVCVIVCEIVCTYVCMHVCV